MITPIFCPACKKPLTNTFLGLKIIKKQCNQYNHSFTCTVNDNLYENSLLSISVKIDLTSGTTVLWDFVTKKIFVFNPKKNQFPMTQSIPWFEPNLLNFNGLIKKIKTYICFM